MNHKNQNRTNGIQEYRRKVTDLLYHVQQLHQRNEKLQAALDRAQAQIASLQRRDIA